MSKCTDKVSRAVLHLQGWIEFSEHFIALSDPNLISQDPVLYSTVDPDIDSGSGAVIRSEIAPLQSHLAT